MWLPNLEGRKGPVYRAIADAIDADVERGTLRAGTRLPPHRDLADHLGVTVTTVTRAYTEAARRGLTSGHVGRGTFIRGREPEENRQRPPRPQHQHPDAGQGGRQSRSPPHAEARAAVDAAARLCAETRASAAPSGDGRLADLSGSPGRSRSHRADRRRAAWACHDALGAAQARRHAARRGPDLFGSAAVVAADALQVAGRLDGRRGAEARGAGCGLPGDTRERACTACRACRTRRRRSCPKSGGARLRRSPRSIA